MMTKKSFISSETLCSFSTQMWLKSPIKAGWFEIFSFSKISLIFFILAFKNHESKSFFHIRINTGMSVKIGSFKSFNACSRYGTENKFSDSEREMRQELILPKIS